MNCLCVRQIQENPSAGGEKVFPGQQLLKVLQTHAGAKRLIFADNVQIVTIAGNSDDGG